MNIVIICGKIISKIDFKFIYHKDKQEKHTSIANCKLQIDNNTIIEAYGYDEVADTLYRSAGKNIWCEGSIGENMQINISTIYYSE